MKYSIESYRRRVQKIWGSAVTVTSNDYKGSHTAIEHKCPIHGTFKRTPTGTVHSKITTACPKCSSRYRRTESELVKEINDKFNNKIQLLENYTG